jgi:tetratricopeptide (TPR) repeat protein
VLNHHRTPAAAIFAVALLACESDASRAEKFEKQARALRESGNPRGAVEYFDKAIQAKPSDQVLVGRAQALAEAGDRAKAIESLAACPSEACGEERTKQKLAVTEAATAKASAQPITDAGSLKSYLDLQHAAETPAACALILATTKASGGAERPRDPGLRQALIAAIQAEIDRATSTLPGKDVNDPDLSNALGFGSALGDEKDCTAMDHTAEQMLHLAQAAPAYDQSSHYAAFVIGLLTAKRDALTATGKPK